MIANSLIDRCGESVDELSTGEGEVTMQQASGIFARDEWQRHGMIASIAMLTLGLAIGSEVDCCS